MWNGISQAKLPAMQRPESISRDFRLLTDWIAVSQNYALDSPGVRLPHPAPFLIAQYSMTKLVRIGIHRGNGERVLLLVSRPRGLPLPRWDGIGLGPQTCPRGSG